MPVDSVPLEETASALRRGGSDATSFVERCCDRFEAVDPDVRAFLAEPERRGRLRREAAELTERFPDTTDRPPLYGVPVGVKDIFHVDGFPTRAGSDLPPDVLGGSQAVAVTRLREAGALVLGKTVTTEFAHFEPGPTRNPHDVDHTPGGSSSGSAAAVAAGTCPLALGTQTAGSVLRPAAFCGVVGFKPTYGRIPTDGVIPLAPALDTVGLFTQDVAGARLAASVLCDDWRSDEAVDGLPTLGVPEAPYLERAEDVARDRFEAQLASLRGAGYEIVRTSALEGMERVLEDHHSLMAAEVALAHHRWFEEYGERYSPVTADLIREGRETSVGTLGDVRDGRRRLRDAIEGTMTERGVDVWVAPSAPGPAPRGLESTGDPVMNTPWTYAGFPAVSIPAGDVDGLPLGLQVVAGTGDDERLLRWTEPMAEAVDG